MKIEFSRKEYGLLLELLHMGEWMATASDAAGNPSRKERYREIIQRLYELAGDAGCAEYVEQGPGEGSDQFFASRRLAEESPAASAIENYDSEVFWEELISRLVERDYEREILRQPLPAHASEEEIQKHKLDRASRLEKRYRDEFGRNNLDNVLVFFGSDRLS